MNSPHSGSPITINSPFIQHEPAAFTSIRTSHRSINMPTKTQRIIGWTLTVLVGLFLIGASGIPKFLDISKIPDMADMMAKLQSP